MTHGITSGFLAILALLLLKEEAPNATILVVGVVGMGARTQCVIVAIGTKVTV
jgi:hypothetical protein